MPTHDTSPYANDKFNVSRPLRPFFVTWRNVTWVVIELSSHITITPQKSIILIAGNSFCFSLLSASGVRRCGPSPSMSLAMTPDIFLVDWPEVLLAVIDSPMFFMPASNTSSSALVKFNARHSCKESRRHRRRPHAFESRRFMNGETVGKLLEAVISIELHIKYAMQNSMTARRDPRSVMGIVAPWFILKPYIITTLGLFTRSLKKNNTCCVTQGSGMTSFLGICRFNGGFVHCYMKSILTHLFDSTDDYLISWLEGDVMYDAELVTQRLSQVTL